MCYDKLHAYLGVLGKVVHLYGECNFDTPTVCPVRPIYRHVGMSHMNFMMREGLVKFNNKSDRQNILPHFDRVVIEL